MRRAEGRLRIIGGTQRRRLIDFDVEAGVRPTPDRVRQTLFDWLAPLVEGARVIDCFAGSGALAFEALSRGAAHALIVDSSPASARQLRLSVEALGFGGSAKVLQRDALSVLSELTAPVDIAFLDPPFGADLLVPTLDALAPHLAPVHRVYAEWRGEVAPALPPGWEWLRSKQAGQVSYGLLTQAPARAAPDQSHRSA